MESRGLGDSDLEVTPVVLGAWAIGGLMWGGTDERDSIDAIRASLDAGINAVDTAPAYGLGRSEEIVGRALEGRRDGVIVATKCGLRWDRDEGEVRFDLLSPEGRRVRIYHNLRPDSIREECEASLRRLRSEVIDLYQIHWPDPVHPLEDAFAELLRLQGEGKIRHIGVSNFSVSQLEVAKRCGAIVSEQSPYNLIDRGIEKEILPWCREHAVDVLAYSPMGRGLLTGKITGDREFPASDHRHRQAYFERERRARVLAALEQAKPVARDHGVSLGNLAVAWVLGTPDVTAALVGARNREQALENARAAELRLGEAEHRCVGDAFAGIA